MTEAEPLPSPDQWATPLSDENSTARGVAEQSATPCPPAAGGFVTGRLLGRGGSSDVWLVTDPAGRRFALKVALIAREMPGRSGCPSVPVSVFQPADSAGSGASATDSPLSGRRARRSADSTGIASGFASGFASGIAQSLSARSTSERDASADPDRDHVAGTVAPIGSDTLARELRLLQRFHHDHLVSVHRIIDTDQGPALLMDLAAGGSLLDLVSSRGPLPVAEVVTTLVPIAQALGHLHEEGALHGDVTPGNILFTHEGKPLLGDFGTGRLLGSAKSTTAGTPGFIDPSGTGAFESGLDVFALAAVAWFALTGRIPGPAEQRPPLALIVPDVPNALMQLIEDGLSPDRSRRPSASAFARSLLSIAHPQPVDLVPAVHSSVLPELLTRKVEARPQQAGKRWGRRRTTDESKRRRDRVPSRADHAADGRNQTRLRRILGTIAGAAAVFLLVLGITLTIGGSHGPETLLSEPAAQGGQGVQEKVIQAEVEPADGVRADSRPENEQVSDPVQALGRLVDRRAVAFATADPDVLDEVDVVGSPAMVADQEAVTALEQSGRSLRDLTITIRDPRLMSDAGDTADPALAAMTDVAAPPAGVEVAVVQASARISSYTEAVTPPSVGAEADREEEGDGTDVERGSTSLMAAGSQELIFVLWSMSDGWRIHSVVGLPA